MQQNLGRESTLQRSAEQTLEEMCVGLEASAVLGQNGMFNAINFVEQNLSANFGQSTEEEEMKIRGNMSVRDDQAFSTLSQMNTKQQDLQVRSGSARQYGQVNDEDDPAAHKRIEQKKSTAPEQSENIQKEEMKCIRPLARRS